MSDEREQPAVDREERLTEAAVKQAAALERLAIAMEAIVVMLAREVGK
jgi:hypothetical protein